MDLPYDGYQVLEFTLKSIPEHPVLAEVNADGEWRPTTSHPTDPKKFLIGVKGPGYADIPPHPEAIEITKTHLPRINVNGIIDWDEMIYLWDPEDNR